MVEPEREVYDVVNSLHLKTPLHILSFLKSRCAIPSPSHVMYVCSAMSLLAYTLFSPVTLLQS